MNGSVWAVAILFFFFFFFLFYFILVFFFTDIPIYNNRHIQNLKMEESTKTQEWKG